MTAVNQSGAMAAKQCPCNYSYSDIYIFQLMTTNLDCSDALYTWMAISVSSS